MSQPSRREQRRAERLAVSGVSGEVHVPQPIIVTELSRQGMQVETACALLLDSLHEFRITLAGQPLVIKGRIVHSRISDVDRDVVTYLSGIEFVEVSDRVVAIVENFVATVARSRAT